MHLLHCDAKLSPQHLCEISFLKEPCWHIGYIVICNIVICNLLYCGAKCLKSAFLKRALLATVLAYWLYCNPLPPSSPNSLVFRYTHLSAFLKELCWQQCWHISYIVIRCLPGRFHIPAKLLVTRSLEATLPLCFATNLSLVFRHTHLSCVSSHSPLLCFLKSFPFLSRVSTLNSLVFRHTLLLFSALKFFLILYELAIFSLL